MSNNRTQIIVALIGLMGVVATVLIPNWSSIFTDDTAIVKEDVISVLSVNHASETVGKYFNFNVGEVDKILNSQTWQKSLIEVTHVRSKKTGRAIVWRAPNGGFPGDGHGRWDDGSAKPGDWETGDKILVIRKIQ